jgi:hypothetical protein
MLRIMLSHDEFTLDFGAITIHEEVLQATTAEFERTAISGNLGLSSLQNPL